MVKLIIYLLKKSKYVRNVLVALLGTLNYEMTIASVTKDEAIERFKTTDAYMKLIRTYLKYTI